MSGGTCYRDRNGSIDEWIMLWIDDAHVAMSGFPDDLVFLECCIRHQIAGFVVPRLRLVLLRKGECVQRKCYDEIESLPDLVMYNPCS